MPISTQFLGAQVSQSIFMGLILGSLYSSLGNDFASTSSRIGLILVSVLGVVVAAGSLHVSYDGGLTTANIFYLLPCSFL